MHIERTDQDNVAPGADITFRRGNVDDSYNVFQLFEETLADLNRRMGSDEPTSWQDPAALAEMWEERRSLYEHLATTAEQFWIAERAGTIIGFARSIQRDGLRQLTDFFVRPTEQSTGVGRELFANAFPPGGATRKSIIASLDLRAQALYLRHGLYPRFPIYYFGRKPVARSVASDLSFVPITGSSDHLAKLVDLDRTILEYGREVDHRWLMRDRQGYLYYRNGHAVGYGYLGRRSGPFALLDQHDFPAVLAHAESTAATRWQHFGLEVPMVNRVAVDYLLDNGFRMDSFISLFMSDSAFGHFERYIATSPPFFL